jgi:hypothetical protein
MRTGILQAGGGRSRRNISSDLSFMELQYKIILQRVLQFMFYNISYAIHEPAIHAGWFALPGIRFDNNVVKPAY